jgi:hypothetical protein
LACALLIMAIVAPAASIDETLLSLKRFSMVDAAAGRWRGLRGPVVVVGDDGKLKSTVGIASMVAKRDKFLKYTCISEDERRERAEKRARAAERVRKALQREDDSHVIDRPLRRFGLKMMIVVSRTHAQPVSWQPSLLTVSPSRSPWARPSPQVVEHTYSKKEKKELLTRRMLVLEDSLKWDKFHDYIANSIDGKSKTGYSFAYIALFVYPRLEPANHARHELFESTRETSCVIPASEVLLICFARGGVLSCAWQPS